MLVACAPHVRYRLYSGILAVVLTLCVPSALAAAADAEKAEKNRRKPLQRCDQMKGDAELECLQKARERVVDTRKKREISKGEESAAGDRKN
jgi:hypothetical protein